MSGLESIVGSGRLRVRPLFFCRLSRSVDRIPRMIETAAAFLGRDAVVTQPSTGEPRTDVPQTDCRPDFPTRFADPIQTVISCCDWFIVQDELPLADPRGDGRTGSPAKPQDHGLPGLCDAVVRDHPGPCVAASHLSPDNRFCVCRTRFARTTMPATSSCEKDRPRDWRRIAMFPRRCADKSNVAVSNTGVGRP